MCHLQELYAKYQDKDLVVLGFNAMDDKKIASGMLAENGVTFPNIIDTSDAGRKVCYQEYQHEGMNGVPLSYIIGRDGKIVDAWYGGKEEHPRGIAALRKTGGQLAEAIRQEVDNRAAKAAPEVAAAATRLFDALRAADYDHDWINTKDWEHFPAKDVDYCVDHNYPGWVRWVCKKFKENPITDAQCGEVFANPGGLPTLHFELHLKDGEVLQGDLPFSWDPKKKRWVGQAGLDWHLQKSP